MTPLETELLHQLGILRLLDIEILSIQVFFYGASSESTLVTMLGPSTSSAKVSLLYFSLRRSLSSCTFPPSASQCFLVRPDLPRFHRRRGFSNRIRAATSIVTFINFLLFSLTTGIDVAKLFVLIRRDFIFDINYPLLEKRASVKNPFQDLNVVSLWSMNLPVSSNLAPLDSVSIHTRWRYYSAISLSFGGLGPSSKINDG